MAEEKVAEETQTEQGKSAAPTTLTEADLAKSLRELEGKDDEAVVEETKVPSVTATTLEKNTAQAIQEKGSAGLKRSLEVSQVLGEFSTVVGDHIDASLEALQKSVQAGAERDLAFLGVMTALKKSIDELAATVESYGDTPASTPKSASVATSEVLTKSIGTDEKQPEQAIDPTQVRAKVSAGLVSLTKSAEPGSPEATALQHKALLFESSGQIDDVTLQKAIAASGM